MQYLINRYSRMCESVGQKFGGRILDFCCGSGDAVKFFRSAGYEAEGFEPFRGFAPESAHFRTLGWADPYTMRSTLPDLDVGSIRTPYDDRSFDFVYSQETLEHVLNHDATFRELARITKKGGVGVHTFPARYRLIEPHIQVPLGWIFRSLAYYFAWYTLTGINPTGNKASSAYVIASTEHHYATWSLNYPRPAKIIATAKRYFRHAAFVPQLWEDMRWPWLYTRTKNVVLLVHDPL